MGVVDGTGSALGVVDEANIVGKELINEPLIEKN